MRTITCLLALLIIFIAGCRTSDNVVNGRFIQKRKYNHGWHVERASDKKQPMQAVVEDTPTAATAPATRGNIPESANKIDASISADVDEVLTLENKPHTARAEEIKLASKAADDSDATDTSVAPQEIQKKKKAKLDGRILWGWNSVALGSWFEGWWGGLSVLNIPALAIGLSLLGIVLIIAGFGHIKKSKTKKLNIVVGVFGIILGAIVLIASLAAL